MGSFPLNNGKQYLYFFQRIMKMKSSDCVKQLGYKFFHLDFETLLHNRNNISSHYRNIQTFKSELYETEKCPCFSNDRSNVR